MESRLVRCSFGQVQELIHSLSSVTWTHTLEEVCTSCRGFTFLVVDIAWLKIVRFVYICYVPWNWFVSLDDMHRHMLAAIVDLSWHGIVSFAISWYICASLVDIPWHRITPLVDIAWHIFVFYVDISSHKLITLADILWHSFYSKLLKEVREFYWSCLTQTSYVKCMSSNSHMWLKPVKWCCIDPKGISRLPLSSASVLGQLSCWNGTIHL